jgi:6-phosphogluconolactonase (cycloisomerase 2 family)
MDSLDKTAPRIKRATILFALCAAIVGVLVSAAPAYSGDDDRSEDLVFVQTNELTGNRIVVLERSSNGRLDRVGTYTTGGSGGAAAPGTQADRLASQGSLVYDARRSLLLAANAGSDSLSLFRVRGDRLELEDVEPSGGDFPVSVAVYRDLVYVVNGGNDGRLQGFRIEGNHLRPLERSSRSLGLTNTDPPAAPNSPGQVGFTPDGRKLIVTTKAARHTIEVFVVRPDGRLSRSPVVNLSATPVPFSFTFDPFGRLVAAELGASSVSTYTIQRDGSLTDAQSLSDNQVDLCWIVRARGYYYVANTGSNTLSGYRIDTAGTPSLLTPSGIVATTPAGPIDMAVSGRGNYLYSQTGAAGTIEEFHVERDGTLTHLGSVTGLPQGMQGIAAT